METEQDRQPEVAPEERLGWWHHSHPTFAGITGFFAGMLFVTAVPGFFAGVLRLLFSYETAEKLFPFVLLALALPIAMLVKRKTRRFAQFMFVGMVVTAAVVLGVTSLVLYFMVDA
ncbi:hypothetical protein [Nocardioides okcheonensis]|uniref:hypothetical protein n=1 Tax=Nocardioides okcheonensis TaxID=2894081 RepID=UPI001E2B4C02|nr:hypothetical protein [Nocardioides okcheonensis]UFN45713.1 hypothetical protein LN652_05740 [Nocardioides okcheonensis]